MFDDNTSIGQMDIHNGDTYNVYLCIETITITIITLNTSLVQLLFY